ncbi:MAG TPA: hypothetical protein VFA09_10655 [Ktedonobacteraceae bacterium]|nr:hypothetical protein [Ktedonobacteraceae bacterium]
MKGKAVPVVLCCLLTLAVIMTVLPRSAGMTARAKSRVPDSNPVTYYGGPVAPGTMNVYAIFWFPGDQGAMSTYMSAIKQYYRDVGGNRLYNMLTEYAGNNGTPTSAALAGVWEDTGTSYNTQLTLQDFINEVKLAIVNNNWPTGGYNNYFPIYLLPGANTVAGIVTGHGSFGPQDNPTIFGYILYCEQGGMCGVPTHPNDPNSYATDGAINASAHEQFEAATDGGGDFDLGWRGEGEIGDLCAGKFGPTPYPYDGGQANQEWVNSHGIDDYYIIQEMESNSPAGCILGV